MNIDTKKINTKISDLSVGDLILISDSSTPMRAAGFVVKIESHSIILSHEDPFAKISWFPYRGGGVGFTRGDRSYIISNFPDPKIEILKKAQPK